MRASDAKYHSPFSYSAIQAGYVYLGERVCVFACWLRVGSLCAAQGCGRHNVWPCSISQTCSAHSLIKPSVCLRPHTPTHHFPPGGKIDDITVLVSYVSLPSRV
jgi:hypothetical protein